MNIVDGASRFAKWFVPLRMRNAIRLFLRRHPIEYRSRWPDLEMFQLSRNDLVFDVGANIGDFIECVLAYEPWAIVHAFEPLQEPFCQIKDKFKDYRGIFFQNIALGGECGRRCFYQGNYDQISSFLKINPDMAKKIPRVDFGIKRTIDVPIETLDAYVRRTNIQKIKLLKIDVQGYEMEVLKGACRTLPAIEYIYTEAQMQELYNGAPTYNSIFSFLSNRGFMLERMTSFRFDTNNDLFECDMIFKNIIRKGN